MTTFAHIQSLIAEQLGIDTDLVTPDSNLFALGADSLDIIEISMKIEEWVDEEITDDQLDSLRTVGDAVRMVEDFLGAKEDA